METGKNRSSILKPRKPRNPLSDLDLIEPVEVDSPVETTRRSSIRRVSFASSNFVKEFATDTDKNTTVWDTTYEEMLNKSDSTHSSENVHQMVYEVEVEHIISDGKPAKISQNLKDLSVHTCSEAAEKIGLIKSDVCVINDNSEVSINFYEHGGEDIESDSSLCCIDNCENRIIEAGNLQSPNVINTRQTDDMTIAQHIIQKGQFHTGDTDVNVKGVPDSKCLLRVSPSNVQTMPFTNLFGQTQNLTATDKENIPTQSGFRISMPNLSHRKLCQSMSKVEGHCGSSLSKMKQFVKKEEYNILKNNQNFSTFNNSSTTAKIDTFVDNDNVEPVQRFFDSKKCITKNETVLSNNTLELTQPFSGSTQNSFKNRATLGTSNMELTQNLQYLNKTECSIKNRTIVADENMEITQQFSVVDKINYNTRNKTIMMDENLEFTQQLPAFNFLPLKINSSNKSLGKGNENKTVIADESMEITQQLSVVDSNSYIPRNKTIMMNEIVEFTQQLPPSNFLAFNVNDINESLDKGNENRTVIADESMEITEQIPIVDSSSCNLKNKTIVMDENIEFTQQLPASNFLVFNVNDINESLDKGNENRTVIADESMEITEQIPIVDSSSCILKNKTIVMDKNIEYTQQLPASEFLVLDGNNINKPLSKDYDVNKEDNSISQIKTMDSTQPLHNSNVENNAVSNTSTASSNKDIKAIEKESIVATPIAAIGRNIELIHPLVKGVSNDGKVWNNSLTAAAKEITAFNCNNNVNSSKLTASNACELPSINHSFHVSRRAEDDEVKGNTINITCTTPMDVDSIVVTKSPVVLNQNTEGVNNTSTSVDNIPIYQLKCENNKSSCTPAGNLTPVDMDKVMMTELPVETYKKQVANDVPENKDEKFLLQVEGENRTNTCLLTDNNTNQELTVDNQTVKKVNTSSAFNASKYMNVSNDALNAVNNSLPTIFPTQNQNLDLLFGVNKSTTIELVHENVNKTETQINTQDKETKEAPKEISVSKQNISGCKTPGSSFHMTFTPFSPGLDDTQHLINYSLTHKQPKSDFSNILTGDLNPSFLSSKFMPLGGFSSDAFPVSLETSRNNQTHLEHTTVDKVKDYNVFPECVAAGDSNAIQFEHEEHYKEKNSVLPMSADTINTNPINLEPVELTKNKKCCAFPASLETHLERIHLGNDKNYDKHNKDKSALPITYDVDETNTEIGNKESKSKLKRPSLENIESIVICKKSMLCNTEENDAKLVNMNENMETSAIESRTMNISQENLTLHNSVSLISDTFPVEAEDFIFNITQSINVNASMNKSTHQLQETYVKRALIKQKVEDFMEEMTKKLAVLTKNSIILRELYDEEAKEICRPFKQHSCEDFKTNVDSSAECSFVEPINENIVTEQRALFHTANGLTMDIERVFTLKEKIEEKQKRCKNYWNVLSIKDDKCEFDTLYKTIRLTVQLDKATGIVNKTDICCNILDDSEPTALFVHKIFKDRLSPKIIQSAVGERYDILTLLDYVYMNMQNMLAIHKEFNSFAKRYNLKMDENFGVTFKMVNLHLRSTWCIFVNMSDMENISEDSITAHAKIGTVNETEIKRFAIGCPRGVTFLKNFINNILGYIELLKKRNNMIKS